MTSCMDQHSIEIQTGSRLHFGPLSYRPERGRHFGGIGMMIATPGWDIIAQSSSEDSFSDEELLAPLVQTIREKNPSWGQPITIQFRDHIPRHCGLGSGTQLGMAVTEAIGRLHGETEFTAQQLASYSQRGHRSAIGLHGYLQGGFLVDAGHQSGEAIGQIACRFDFPEEWRVLLVTPQDGAGYFGDAEIKSFAKLSSMSASRTGELCRLALTEILPALKHQDYRSFARALYEYGKVVGEFFAGTQHGVFSHPEMESLVDRLRDQGIVAAAQSSWGPTVALVLPDAAKTQEAMTFLRDDIFGCRCRIRETHGLNRGRELRQDNLPNT